MKSTLHLYLFVDALGWEVLRRHPEFLQGLAVEKRRAKTVFGYSSACDPSIISGKLPSEHRHWSSFYYSPDTCPYSWLKYLNFLPSIVMDNHRIRTRLSRLIKKLCGFTGYFQLYTVPFDRLPYFDYAEKKQLFAPGGLIQGTSLIDLYEAHGIDYFVDDRETSDQNKIRELKARLHEKELDVAYLLLGKLDALMHGVGPYDPKVTELVRWYDAEFRDLIAEANVHYDEVKWVVFSDHGMHEVRTSTDLKKEVENLGFTFGKEYAAVYDSTMARFWFFSETARRAIEEHLEGLSCGYWMSDEELDSLGCLFEDRMYGEKVYLMESHRMIAPCDMGKKQIPGMHGYHPDDPDSWASITANEELPEWLTGIEHLFNLFLTHSRIEERESAKVITKN